jgi:N-glycosylase/DNA lyase
MEQPPRRPCKQNPALHSKCRIVEGLKIYEYARQIIKGRGARANSKAHPLHMYVRMYTATNARITDKFKEIWKEVDMA